MITCSKCNAAFHIEVNRITKHSTIPCIKCGNECFVKLLDLEHHSVDNEYSLTNGFKSLSNMHHHEEDLNNDTGDSFSTMKHLIIILFIAKILLLLFVVGIIKITHIDEKFPMVARFYNVINIIPRKVTRVIGFKTSKAEQGLECKISVENTSDKSDIISDVKIVLFDVFKSQVMEYEHKPYMLIKGNTVEELEIIVPIGKKQPKYISLYLNGKPQIQEEYLTSADEGADDIKHLEFSGENSTEIPIPMIDRNEGVTEHLALPTDQ